MKGKLISVLGVPHVYSEQLQEAFELPMRYRAELMGSWLGKEFNLDTGSAEDGQPTPTWLSAYLAFIRDSKKTDLVGFYDYLEANYEPPIKRK